MIKNKSKLDPNIIFYKFEKDNKPGKKYISCEIWENKHPDDIVVIEHFIYSGNVINLENLDEVVSKWKEMAYRLKDPILTIQGDNGKGVILSYYYSKKKNGTPPNAAGMTIKPIFDKDIRILKIDDLNNKDFDKLKTLIEGTSLVYNSKLNSPTIKGELSKLNDIYKDFFSGELKKIAKFSETYHSADIIKNDKLTN